MDPEHRLPCAERSCDIVGGHVDPGEARPDAMRRELAEETGLVLDEPALRLWYDGEAGPDEKVSPELRNHWQIWVGRADLTDDDIVVGEGRQIVFVDPGTLDRLDLAVATAWFLPRFLASPDYEDLLAS